MLLSLPSMPLLLFMPTSPSPFHPPYYISLIITININY